MPTAVSYPFGKKSFSGPNTLKYGLLNKKKICFRGWVPPINVTPPAITGNRWIGQTLSTTNGEWDDAGSTISAYTYQWKRNGAVIVGATAITYVLVAADGGTTITCTVTAINMGGGTSAETAAVSAMSPSKSFIEGRTAVTAGTTTHTAVSFGEIAPAGEKRYVVVCIAYEDLSSARTITSVTVGGIAATRVIRSQADASLSGSEIWIADVPTGTSGTISFTSSANRTSISVYRVMNITSATATSTAIIATSGNGPANLSVTTGDVVLAVQATFGTTDVTFTAVTEDYDVTAGSFHRGASGSSIAATTGTLGVNSSPVSGRQLCVAAFR
jgi:hypothetical protein